MKIKDITLQSEAGLIGAILLNAQALDDALNAGVDERMFGHAVYRAAFRCLSRLIGEGKEPDVVDVWLSMKSDGLDVPVEQIHATISMVGSSRMAKALASHVVAGWQRREIERVATEIYRIGMESGRDPESVVDEMQSVFSSLVMQRKARVPIKVGELALKRLDRLQAASEGKGEPVAVALGIPAVDALLGGGFRSGGLYILAARPSVGKSSFAESLALWVAGQGHPALFLSQEMSAEEVADRALSHESKVRYDLITQAKCDQDEHWMRLADGADILANTPLWVDDEPALNLARIRSKLLTRPGIKLLVLDYLQLCATAGKQNRAIEIGEISRGLKAMAKEFGISVLALSQLNRDVEKRVGGRPVMSDLRDSGEIEQDADVVMFLWRLAPPVPGEVQRIGCAIEKNRQGRIGGITLAFNGDTQTWGELSDRVEETVEEPQRPRVKRKVGVG